MSTTTQIAQPEQPSQPGSSARTELVDQAWRDDYPHLVNVAFRLLGEIAAAEDTAQEAFIRLAAQRMDDIDDVRGWLTVVTSRLCLDRLRSAYTRHERSAEPGPMAAAITPDAAVDPANQVALEADVVAALLVVLQRLSPAERVAFVLHDVFRTPFADIAVTLRRPAATCRQLAHRGRQKIDRPPMRVNQIDRGAHRRVTDAFLTACHNGDLAGLAESLNPDVWGRADVLADRPASPVTARGPAQVAANLIRYLPRGVTLVDHPATQAPTLLAYHHRRLFAVITLTIDNGAITSLHVIVDPDRVAAEHEPTAEGPHPRPHQ